MNYTSNLILLDWAVRAMLRGDELCVEKSRGHVEGHAWPLISLKV